MDNPHYPAQQLPYQQEDANIPPQQPAYQQPYPPQPAPSQTTHSPQAQNPQQYGLQVVDSLTSNEFKLEINGQTVTGVFAVTGLCSFSLKVDEGGKPIGINYPPLVVTKMVQQDPRLPFNAWVREAVQARGTVLPTREISVVAMDEGIETRRWVYHQAWISEVTFSDFDTALEFLIEEKITLRYSSVEEIWPNR